MPDRNRPARLCEIPKSLSELRYAVHPALVQGETGLDGQGVDPGGAGADQVLLHSGGQTAGTGSAQMTGQGIRHQGERGAVERFLSVCASIPDQKSISVKMQGVEKQAVACLCPIYNNSLNTGFMNIGLN